MISHTASGVIFIAGGGTGGHLYPGIAVAREILKRYPQMQIEFVGSPRGLEVKIIPNEGFPLHLLPIGPLSNMGLVAQLVTFLKLPLAFLRALQLILSRKPKVILGVGGYASFPVVFIGALLGCPTAIWEPNAFPGMSNRILSQWVKRVFLVFEAAQEKLNAKSISVVGVPLRGQIRFQERAPSEKLRVLVFGGSQGARGINMGVTGAIEIAARKNQDWLKQIEIIHQTGEREFTLFEARYKALNLPNVKVTPYLKSIHEEYAWADIVVCRSGAGTIAELAGCRKASVLIPLPTAADDHQTVNARALADKGAAILVPQKEFEGSKFSEVIQGFLRTPEKRTQLEQAIGQFHQDGSAGKIVDQLMEIAK
ncbi:MAG: undecaprenyldiphospho-muramoylpentapeptide beta-N-acetylglucosaminyltransferase [Bdellovibrionales bacterium]|nr:undecaprenyldiphospho-muramoylpentapeptide beta-N-acetylglucosaminyltransferase [Bdellovibrionales bacterium]